MRKTVKKKKAYTFKRDTLSQALLELREKLENLDACEWSSNDLNCELDKIISELVSIEEDLMELA